MNGGLILLWLGIHWTTAAEDFCSVDTFAQSRGARRLGFSKELSEAEFAVVGSFMSLHCCAAAFRTIEWFKNGRPYPWPEDMSSLIINPASHNQTVYTANVAPTDGGNYHCLVSNATHVLRHNINLTVSESSGSIGLPKATYKPKDVFHKIGETARFYCEAYVGNIKLPDAKSEIFWTKSGENASVELGSRISQRLIQREGKRVIGLYLVINEVQSGDFGQYWCSVSNTGDQILEMPAILHQVIEDVLMYEPTLRFCLAAGFAMLSTAIVLFTALRYHFQLQMLWKRFKQRLYHTELGFDVDVTVVYHEKDIATALGQVVPTLQHKYHYTCSSWQLQPHRLLSKSEICSRRLLAIVTPSALSSQWSSRGIADYIQRLIDLHPKVICLLLKDLPNIDVKTEDGRRLKEVMARVHYVTYAETQDDNFWTILLLGLPHHRKSKSAHSRESLENLM